VSTRCAELRFILHTKSRCNTQRQGGIGVAFARHDLALSSRPRRTLALMVGTGAKGAGIVRIVSLEGRVAFIVA